MNKSLPDKWIRKAVFDLIDDINVDGEFIEVFDTRVTGPDYPLEYIIMSTQTNTVDKNNKCEWFWESTILLDINTTYLRPGNTGSRLKVDNITDAVRNALNSLTLDVSSGLTIITKTQSYPSDINTVTDNEIVFRKFIRLELLIK